ncbi:hypothetical protein H9654_08800 [Stenotrophomonas sp. Sa5BUN4]|uniref:Uncharacterized protein n=1 Tax=Stenotrophomonas lacuserhaii TaxID=2760084 RepID=A0A8X8K3N6_9GAMM|nr:hypothetical protein [Stenotrophomonas pennii]MBD7954304.1 hypothetical protein [Stenotrophomonas pennii]
MIQWTCVFAGGPDHGRIHRQWVPRSVLKPLAPLSSDGAHCPPMVVSYDRTRCHAICVHPKANPDDVQLAERIAQSLGKLNYRPRRASP